LLLVRFLDVDLASIPNAALAAKVFWACETLADKRAFGILPEVAVDGNIARIGPENRLPDHSPNEVGHLLRDNASVGGFHAEVAGGSLSAAGLAVTAEEAVVLPR
jgi:hypothetical protein